jgi:hypothetical protein
VVFLNRVPDSLVTRGASFNRRDADSGISPAPPARSRPDPGLSSGTPARSRHSLPVPGFNYGTTARSRHDHQSESVFTPARSRHDDTGMSAGTSARSRHDPGFSCGASARSRHDHGGVRSGTEAQSRHDEEAEEEDSWRTVTPPTPVRCSTSSGICVFPTISCFRSFYHWRFFSS